MPPEAALYVGDLYSVDVVGARRAGLDAVLLDPRGYWGPRDCPLARGLQDALPTRPLLIALTGTDGLADALFRAGFDRYYLKPPDEPALVTTLEQHRATLTTRGA